MSDASSLIDIIYDPFKYTDESLMQCDDIIGEYPYFQLAHIAKSKILHSNNTIDFAKAIRQAAIYAPDRSKLHELIHHKTEFRPDIVNPKGFTWVGEEQSTDAVAHSASMDIPNDAEQVESPVGNNFVFEAVDIELQDSDLDIVDTDENFEEEIVAENHSVPEGFDSAEKTVDEVFIEIETEGPEIITPSADINESSGHITTEELLVETDNERQLKEDIITKRLSELERLQKMDEETQTIPTNEDELEAAIGSVTHQEDEQMPVAVETVDIIIEDVQMPDMTVEAETEVEPVQDGNKNIEGLPMENWEMDTIVEMAAENDPGQKHPLDFEEAIGYENAPPAVTENVVFTDEEFEIMEGNAEISLIEMEDESGDEMEPAFFPEEKYESELIIATQENAAEREIDQGGEISITENVIVSKSHIIDTGDRHDFYTWLHLIQYKEHNGATGDKVEDDPDEVADDELAQWYVEHELPLPGAGQGATTLPTSKKSELVDQFIKTEPRIKPLKAEFYKPANMARKSVEFDENLVTETLAAIFRQQGLTEKAIRAYEKLSLVFPEKKHFFAALIKEIKYATTKND